MCDRWQAFENFLADMGEFPPGHSIERRDVNKDYEPDNCFWMPKSEQMDNTRRTLRFTIRGETKTLKSWCAQYGVNHDRTYARVKKLGWDIERALTHNPRGVEP